MDNPTGIVQSFAPESGQRRAVVRVDIVSACPRCAAGKGCGAGLLSGGPRQQHIDAVVAAGETVQRGDTVELALASENLLKAALLVYGVPLLGALLAAGLAYSLGASDLQATFAALAGLAAGVVFSWYRCRDSHCLTQFTPTITKRLSATAED